MSADVVELQKRRLRRAAAQGALGNGGGDVPLVDRLAALLSAIVDEPLLVLPSDGQGAVGPRGQLRPEPLRLAHFKPELAEAAAALLEEAGF